MSNLSILQLLDLVIQFTKGRQRIASILFVSSLLFLATTVTFVVLLITPDLLASLGDSYDISTPKFYDPYSDPTVHLHHFHLNDTVSGKMVGNSHVLSIFDPTTKQSQDTVIYDGTFLISHNGKILQIYGQIVGDFDGTYEQFDVETAKIHSFGLYEGDFEGSMVGDYFETKDTAHFDDMVHTLRGMHDKEFDSLDTMLSEDSHQFMRVIDSQKYVDFTVILIIYLVIVVIYVGFVLYFASGIIRFYSLWKRQFDEFNAMQETFDKKLDEQ